jgi:hypothetical protein
MYLSIVLSLILNMVSISASASNLGQSPAVESVLANAADFEGIPQLLLAMDKISTEQVGTLQNAISTIIEAARVNNHSDVMTAVTNYRNLLAQLIHTNSESSEIMNVDDYKTSAEYSELMAFLTNMDANIPATVISYLENNHPIEPTGETIEFYRPQADQLKSTTRHFLEQFRKGSMPLKTPDKEVFYMHDSLPRSYLTSPSKFYTIQNTLKNLSVIESIPQGLVNGGFITPDQLEAIEASVKKIIKAALNARHLDPSEVAKVGLVDFNSAVSDHESLLKTLISEEEYNIDTLIAQNLYVSSIVYTHVSNVFSLDFLKRELKHNYRGTSAQGISDYVKMDPDFLDKLRSKLNPESE